MKRHTYIGGTSCRPFLAQLSIIVGLVLAVVLSAGVPRSTQAATGDVGYHDFLYNGVSAPTADKPQSKLWYNDGIWWGSLFNKASNKYEIYRFNWATDTWSTTGTAIDERTTTQADCLWDGANLYIASSVRTGTSTSNTSARLLKYSYNSTTKTYALMSGFPVTLISSRLETIVLDKEPTPTGKIWVTFTNTNSSGGRNVYVMHSTTDHLNWTTPFVIPTTGANNLESDDISAVVSFNGQIGVMWSNQNDDAMYFAIHNNGDPDNVWSLNPAVQGPKYADDHMNLKSLQADASGRVFAAVKTSLNDVSSSPPNAPLILLLVLDQHGSWSRRTVATVQDNHTRPIVMLDNQNRQIYVFLTYQIGTQTSGAIYYKQVSLDNASMQFPTGLGTPFIKFSTDTHINNSTSTKQPVNSTSGLLVLAGDDSTRYYLHNKLTLGPADTTPPDTTIDSGPSGTVTSTSADFTFSANEAGSTFACSLDGAAFSACSSPTSYSGLADGGHTFQVRATDPVGNTDPTPASRTWTVATGTPDTTPPSVTLTAPSDGATVSGSVTLSADASDNVAVARVDFIVGGEVTGSDTTAPYSISWNSASVVDGSATIIAQAVDTANLATTSAGRTVTVDNTTPDTTIDSGPTGTVTSTSADFTFSANEAGSTFACSLDGAAFSACSSPTSYSGLVDGGHTFQVRATDAAGNTDASPASQTWTVSTGSSGTTLFSDGFESGDFSPWSLVKTGGDGSATVQNSIVKTGSFAAHLSATTSTGSYAYIRQALDTAQTDVTVTGDFQLLAEGVSGANVPFFRLFDSSGTRLISLYRQNLSGNKLYIQINGTNYSTTGFLPLNTWAQLSVHVVTAGTGASTVQVYLDGTQIYGTSTASLGSTGVLNMQVGNDTAKQAFTYIADNISVTR